MRATLLFLAFVTLASLSLAQTTTTTLTGSDTSTTTTAAVTTTTAMPATTTTAMPVTTTAGAPTCTAVNLKSAVFGASSLFNITGSNFANCGSANITYTFTPAPTTTTTTAGPTTTTISTTSTTAGTTTTTTAGTTTTSTTVAPTTTTAGTTTTPAPVTAAPVGPIVPLLASVATDNRGFVYSPSQTGLHIVSLRCGTPEVDVAVCGTFWASPSSVPVVYTINGAAPDVTTITAFKNGFAAAVARAAGVDVSQVLVTAVNQVSRRRAAAFSVTTSYLGTQAQQNPEVVQQTVVTAAQNGALNTQLTAGGIANVATFSVNGGAQQAAGAAITATTTAIPTTPAPSAASVSVVSVSMLVAMIFSALVALL